MAALVLGSTVAPTYIATDPSESYFLIHALFVLSVSGVVWGPWLNAPRGRGSLGSTLHLAVSVALLAILATDLGVVVQGTLIALLVVAFGALTERRTFVIPVVAAVAVGIALALSDATMTEWLVSVLSASVPAALLVALSRARQPTRRAGQYELVRLIGVGGMGEVWQGEHAALLRPAAVKIIRPATRVSADIRAETIGRFRREIQATALLRSPHSVTVYDAGCTSDGDPYYAMEVLDGIDLQRFVERFGPLTAERVAHVLVQTAEALSDAHVHSLVHRDVKPANLFLCRLEDRVDFVKVVDFGLVTCTMPASKEVHLSDPRSIPGTPAYLPPEVALGHLIDGQADVYSLGAVAYFLLTGQTVFDGKTALELAMKHVDAAPPALPGGVPALLDEVVMACLAKDPSRRPSTQSIIDTLAPLAAKWTSDLATAWWQAEMPPPAEWCFDRPTPGDENTEIGCHEQAASA